MLGEKGDEVITVGGESLALAVVSRHFGGRHCTRAPPPLHVQINFFGVVRRLAGAVVDLLGQGRKLRLFSG